MRLRALRDLDASEGTFQLHASPDDKAFILHPTPNPNDPNDPLRWCVVPVICQRAPD
jgi:hypothetical protein